MIEPRVSSQQECKDGLSPILGDGLMSQIQSSSYTYRTLTAQNLKEFIEKMGTIVTASPNQMAYYNGSTMGWGDLVKEKELSYEEILIKETENYRYNNR